MACADENTIVAYLEGRLSPDELEKLFVHLDQCAECTQVVFETAGAQQGSALRLDGPTAPSMPPMATSPMRIARYQVSRILGAGGMGVVYAGYDPQLDRKVAIKLLRPDRQTRKDALQARLMREAQAMARLSHPNVITVFEVGALGDQLFIAMELVDGQTLAGWLVERPRSWREILDVFLAAGRGLDAAHRAGLVHRDFKPDNVLVARDGRVRVTDFGLARMQGESVDQAAPSPQSPLHSRMTRTGALVGTPAYMAPEQLRGEAADARTDVFSFCVALYEALSGVRPFSGNSVEELQAEVAAGRIQPARTRLPSWLRRVVFDGLNGNPAARPQSMQVLLTRLASDPARRRRTVLAVLGVLLLFATTVVAAVRQRAQICRGADEKLATQWNPTRKTAIEKAFAATGKVFAADAATYVLHTLDAYATAWSAMRTDACEATRRRGEQSEELLDLRMQCLDERLLELGAVAEVLSHGGAETVEKAAAIAAPPPLSRCADADALRQAAPPPRDRKARAEYDLLLQEIAHVRPLQPARRDSELLKELVPFIPRARALAHPGLLSEMLSVQGSSLLALSKEDDAVAALKEAVSLALEAHRDELAARAWLRLAYVRGYVHGQISDGEEYLALARAVNRRLHLTDLEADIEHTEAGFGVYTHDGEAMLAHATRAWELRKKALGAESPQTAIELEGVASALREAHRYEESIETHQRALAIMEKAMGKDVPVAMLPLNNLTNVYEDLDRWQDALLTVRRVLTLTEAAYGADAAESAEVRENLAQVLIMLDRPAEAEPILTALAERLDRIGEPAKSSARGSLGMLRALAEARAGHTQTAMRRWRSSMQSGEPFTEYTMYMAEALVAHGANADALEVLAPYEKTPPTRASYRARVERDSAQARAKAK